VIVKNTVFWDVRPRGFVEDYRSFWRYCCACFLSEKRRG